MSDTVEEVLYEEITTGKGERFQARNTGLFVSRDAGDSWQSALDSLKLTETLPITAVQVAPADDDFLIAGTVGGVLCSRNGAKSWEVVQLDEPPPAISALAFSSNFARDKTIFAATLGDGLLVSHNRGARWVAWNFGLLDWYVLCVAVSDNYAEDRTVYIGTETGVFRSTTGGKSWIYLPIENVMESVVSIKIGEQLEVETENGETYQVTLA